MANKPSWLKIKNEYINGEISLDKLSKKYKVSLNTIKQRSMREKWSKQRTEQQTKIEPKLNQKTAEKIAEKQSDFATIFLNLNYAAAKKAAEMLRDCETPQKLKALTAALADIGANTGESPALKLRVRETELKEKSETNVFNATAIQSIKEIFEGLDDDKRDAENVLEREITANDNS